MLSPAIKDMQDQLQEKSRVRKRARSKKAAERTAASKKKQQKVFERCLMLLDEFANIIFTNYV